MARAVVWSKVMALRRERAFAGERADPLLPFVAPKRLLVKTLMNVRSKLLAPTVHKRGSQSGHFPHG
jgi:hypothetical protein